MKRDNTTIPQFYNRRNWLQLSSLAAVALCVPHNLWARENRKLPYQYHLATIENVTFSLPPHKQIPFDWPVAELTASNGSLILKWQKKIKAYASNNYRFRITSATDVREYGAVEVISAITKVAIGTLNISYAHYMQPFEIIISPTHMPIVMEEGIALKLVKGAKPFWFFSSDTNNNEIPEAYLPHLLEANHEMDAAAWKKRLLSFASLSMFGWMEGCVLDGIMMLSKKDNKARKILQQHLDKYFINNSLVYESYNNERMVGTINSVESILPFAMLALSNSNHIMLQHAIKFCTDAADEKGVIADDKGNNRRLKTEECYTISYPLAILAKKLNRPDLEKMSIVNLKARVQLLATSHFIYQNSKELEPPNFSNWARGVAWYLLGLTKTLAELPKNEETISLHTALQQAAEMVMGYQQPNGLFYCFLHRPETGTETSGSAGIAAALAYGYSKKLLPVSCKQAAEKCRKGLQHYFTPDGYLRGTSQVNKGGETLQANGFRIISPYTLGFIGVLENSLEA